MSYSISQIAKALGAEAAGNLDLTVTGAAEPGDAGHDQLALAMSPKYAEALAKGGARAAILWPGAAWQAMGLEAAIFAARPRLAMAGLTAMLDPGQGVASGIHPSAVIDPSAEIGADVSIGPLTVVGARARIGAGSVIGPHCVIGMDAVLGEGAWLREMVSIGARATIGARFIAQPGARIGGDGFSFVTPEVSGAENARKTMGDQGEAKAQAWTRIHSLGAVEIGDDVEVGANCTVDNGTIRNTCIGDGSKLDNLVHVGHNTRIGRDCLLCGQTGVSGSVEIGNNVVLGGQTGVVDNIYIGDGVIAGGGSKILSNVPAGRVIMGYPAVKMDLHTEIYKAQRRLPRLLRDISALKKAVSKPGPSE
ncbi:UDP-3-O-(3-hydroxymyristoyl)glucosamine N-acyltransferase [Ruegeria pomeroyi]|uniref:UDP-3-O-acylglucosamine N-acyltransferase n=2 Tax=Ruegeria pomeroyi TaxID=89184 RepID=LPXD_RUEPO|nr:UDP-3-O-(3-hydroxymyristoyl)glucosamine N-acyltransferase [Ruegeria pomeroyi]Q5LS40.1 RecName: Full=UDP-3-O-acylglucosamine N-acyltransferase [Ruegeria pomeroyi DSS-3]HCE69896.1 UDP-3-O-(3-hydroxymyristoyl)glucosamine N-acyltransferase [Ruegeria sp.]AAV95206.1 UDP-3-O-3-hydroxymyristoyl glucosamine N-acyltransferase [Ruegeria pomeroyi DSS-3]NVK97442.1 UDP-3-O-(3-hydroxymyristoyl)glucosamine N-acyltransferase [Ruegeria pomeroyi]NVL00553.1 UDP-3-O-(3-hydroxymyristoyl)glucosamine N-acyltransfe